MFQCKYCYVFTTHNHLCIYLLVLIPFDIVRKNVYVTVNMCNQGIRVFPENFSEYAYSLKWSGNTRIP